MPVALVRGSVATSNLSTTVYTAFILRDANNIRWATIIKPLGNLDPEITPAGPTGALDVTPLVLKDSSGAYWQVTISITGVLKTTLVSQPNTFYVSLLFSDVNQLTHILTVSTNGNLVTT